MTRASFFNALPLRCLSTGRRQFSGIRLAEEI
jgi:hypothetical protein